MPRRIPIEPDISRKDIADAIEKLRGDILDPDRPSLLSTLNEHREEVREAVAKLDTFIEHDYQPFKADYEKNKNRALGWLAGAGAVGGGVFAAVKHFLLGK